MTLKGFGREMIAICEECWWGKRGEQNCLVKTEINSPLIYFDFVPPSSKAPESSGRL